MITHIFKHMLIDIPVDHLDPVQAPVMLLDLVLDLKCARAVLEEAEVARILYLSLGLMRINFLVIFFLD